MIDINHSDPTKTSGIRKIDFEKRGYWSKTILFAEDMPRVRGYETQCDTAFSRVSA